MIGFCEERPEFWGESERLSDRRGIDPRHFAILAPSAQEGIGPPHRSKRVLYGLDPCFPVGRGDLDSERSAHEVGFSLHPHGRLQKRLEQQGGEELRKQVGGSAS